MRPQFDNSDLDAEFVFDRYLGDTDDLDVLQMSLGEVAPSWSSSLCVWRGPKDQRSIDIGQPGAVKSAVVAQSGERRIDR